MAEIVLFPTETTARAEAHEDGSGDQFLLDEGLELLADFRSIQEEALRASVRQLVKTMATASRATATTCG